MGDLSYSSGLWWNMVRKAVEECYQEWLQLVFLDRLRVKPQLESQAHLWPLAAHRTEGVVFAASGGS